MRIAFLLDRFPQNGGVEMVTINLANALAERGISVSIISKIGSNTKMFDQLNHSVEICGFIDERFEAKNISNLIEQQKFDILINQGAYPATNLILVELRQLNPIPIVSVIHNEPSYMYKDAECSVNSRGWKGLIKRILKRPYLSRIEAKVRKNFNNICEISDAIVLLSKSYIADFTYWVGEEKVRKCKLLSISNPAVSTEYTDLEDKEKTLLFVGRLEERQKRLSRLLCIWEKLQEYHLDWQLNIVGDGPDKAYYEKVAKDKNLKRVKFSGYQSDTSKFYKRSSAIVLTSEYEGMPLVLLEGMAYGCIPVLYNTFKAASDYINDGVNGYLVNPNDEDEFVERLIKIMSDGSVQKRIASKATEISQVYSMENIVILWENLFKELSES